LLLEDLDMARWREVIKSIIPPRGVDLYRFLRHPSYTLVPGPLTYNQDGLATGHHADFLADPLFAESYRLGESTGSFRDNRIQWRAYIACWTASHAKRLEGDFVECGVYRGGLARAIINYVGFQDLPKRFFLCDTYNGLVQSHISDEEKRMGKKAGGYEDCYDAVQKTFAPFPNVRIVKGTVPEVLSQVDVEKVCYLSLDMNCAPPEIAAAEYFWDKLVTGGVILLDDYGWMGYEPQKRAFDEFTARKGVAVLSLPTGQGLILKS
jgi:O-methyltransferase